MRQHLHMGQQQFFKPITLALCVLSLSMTFEGCAFKRAVQETEDAPEQQESVGSSNKIEALNATVSRMQGRIEELDARVSSLSDKVEASKMALENASHSKPMSTEIVATAHAKPSAKRATEDEGLALSSGSDNMNSSSESDDVVMAFNKAMQLFKKGQYAEAEMNFNRVVEQHPDHILAGSAQFFSGESYFMMGEFKLALTDYEKVVSSFKSSPRVPSALVRISQCYKATGNPKVAAEKFMQAEALYAGNPSMFLSPPTAAPKSAAKAAAPAHAEAEEIPTEKVTNPKSSPMDAAPMEPKSTPAKIEDDKDLDEEN